MSFNLAASQIAGITIGVIGTGMLVRNYDRMRMSSNKRKI
jgi:hypothetical protein